jgi:hypothetical protein
MKTMRIMHLSLFFALTILLAACSGGSGSNSGGNTSTTEMAGIISVVTSTTTAPASVCPYGGIEIDSGIDLNKNGKLDPNEIILTKYVCNGPTGLTSLVTVTTEPAGSNCASGGEKVSSGVDNNRNGILDPSEVTANFYVCNGINGTNGTNGTNGLTSLNTVTTEPAGSNCPNGGDKVDTGLDKDRNGILDPSEVTMSYYICNGQNGSNGTNGFNGLTEVTTESSGTNCPSGGLKIDTGLDTNRNGILDLGEITTTNYVCNGLPGPPGSGSGITWVDVTGTSIQAVSNTGYMADSTSQVTITLPVLPTIGDIVQVTGVGTGGWKIAQNAGQSIVTQNLNTVGAIGAVWTLTSAPTAQWFSVASSSDGTKLVAVIYQYLSGRIYTSSNSGGTWTLTNASTGNWSSVASSSDGTKLVAVKTGGGIYTSSDSGGTWTQASGVPTTYFWSSVASSSDGTKLVAVASSGPSVSAVIYTSSDSGVTWTQASGVPTTYAWSSVASSSDGTKLVAVNNPLGIYTSSDSGVTWTKQTSGLPAIGNWSSVASSSDGTKIVAVAHNGGIYTSSDSGGTWTLTSAPTAQWSSVASSSDGTKLVAVVYNGGIYTSSNLGVTWTLTNASTGNWTSVASSSGGTKLVVVANNGGIYTTSGPTAVPSTTVGIAGSISGGQYDAVELLYIGNDTFTILSNEGYLMVQ